MADCDCTIEIKNKDQSKVLIILLSINAFMFFVEITLGLLSQSTALIADAMDMLADAMVYGVGLYAVGKQVSAKIRAATISGWLQVGIGLLVLMDIARRFVFGSEPISALMMGMGLVALIANTICLILISKHRNGEVHMRASWIFSKNDVIANVGVMLAGALVAMTDSRVPDLVIGIVVALVVIRGGVHILKDAKSENESSSCCGS